MIKGEIILWLRMMIIIKMKIIGKNKRKKIASKSSTKKREMSKSENKLKILKIQNFKKNEVQR